MRKVFLFIFFASLLSCGLEDDEQTLVLGSFQLKDGVTLALQEKIGGYLGATTPNVTWIKIKERNGKEQQVGKINRFLDMGTISFEPINDSLISLQYIDSILHYKSKYIININKRIYPNDGSPYLEPN